MDEHELMSENSRSFSCDIVLPKATALKRYMRISRAIELSNIERISLALNGISKIVYNPKNIVDVLNIDLVPNSLYHPWLSPQPTDELLDGVKHIRIEIYTKKPVAHHPVFIYTSSSVNRRIPLCINYTDYMPLSSDARKIEMKLERVPSSIHVYLQDRNNNSIVIHKTRIELGNVPSVYKTSTLDLTRTEGWSSLVGTAGVLNLTISHDEDPTKYDLHAYCGTKCRVISNCNGMVMYQLIEP